MIFELPVQTQLIISHLTGKSIKLYVMGIIAHFNLYWFNSFVIHLRRCFIKFNMIESKTEPKETNLINRIKSTVIEILKVYFEWIWHEIITCFLFPSPNWANSNYIRISSVSCGISLWTTDSPEMQVVFRMW